MVNQKIRDMALAYTENLKAEISRLQIDIEQLETRKQQLSQHLKECLVELNADESTPTPASQEKESSSITTKTIAVPNPFENVT